MASKKCSKQSGGHADSQDSGQGGCSMTPSLFKAVGHKGWLLTVVKRPHSSLAPQQFSLFKERVKLKCANNKNTIIMEKFLTEFNKALLVAISLGELVSLIFLTDTF